jgi:WD40 repeat protein
MNRRQWMLFSLLIALLFIPLGLARADDRPPRTGPIAIVTLDRERPVLFDKDIEPILVNKCHSCHSGSVTEGKLDLTSYESLMKGGKRGHPVVPGKSADSLLAKLAGKTRKPYMPPKSEEPLMPIELALIKAWIDQGARAPLRQRPRPGVVLGRLPARVHPVRAVVISPDGSLVVAGRGNEIHVYDAASGKHLRSLTDPALLLGGGSARAHVATVDSLAFSPDGTTLASGSFQEVLFWDIHTGKILRRLSGVADRVVALAFAPDRTLLAAGGGAPAAEGEIKLWNVADGSLVTDIKDAHSDTVFGLAFSPDGTKLASCGADKFVKVFDVPAGRLLKSFEGHTHHVLDVAWKADGKLLASAGADTVIKVWDYDKGEQVRTITGHTKQVTRLGFVGKTPEIVTASGDHTVRRWNVESGAELRNLGDAGDFLYALAASADGAHIAAGGEEGVVRLYDAKTGRLAHTLVPSGTAAHAKK